LVVLSLAWPSLELLGQAWHYLRVLDISSP
jgi:hypothetical protein